MDAAFKIIPWKMKKCMPAQKPWVHSSTVHNHQNTEPTQMFVRWWMDKQNMVYLYNRLFSNKAQWSSDICYSVYKPQQHYAKLNKAIIKDYIIYDSIQMKCPNM